MWNLVLDEARLSDPRNHLRLMGNKQRTISRFSNPLLIIAAHSLKLTASLNLPGVQVVTRLTRHLDCTIHNVEQQSQ